MKTQFDMKAVDCCFFSWRPAPYSSAAASLWSESFYDPLTVLDKIGDKKYGIRNPESRQKTRLCHINLLLHVALAAMGQMLEVGAS